MIPLRLNIDTEAAEPYVVRLRSLEGLPPPSDALHPHELALDRVEGEASTFRGAKGILKVFGVDPSELDGDTLLVVPRRKMAHRLIRANSRHNTLLVTERCDQLCVMCSQPPKKHHTDMFPLFETAVMLAPEHATIGLSGGEPTLFKADLLRFLRRTMEARPDVNFHILTNGQHLNRTDVTALRALDMTRILWGVPCYSSDRAIHDELVGKPGAFARLRPSLGLLCEAGARVELRTVVMRPNTHGLPDLARLITTTLPFVEMWAIMQLENIGYARQNWNSLFFDSSTGFEPIAKALDFAVSRGIRTELYNFPLCTVPMRYRSFAPSTISDWKRSYVDDCAACSLKPHCGGFFEWHPKVHGYGRFGAA